MSTNCSLLNGPAIARESDEDAPPARDESSSLSRATAGPFGKSHLEDGGNHKGCNDNDLEEDDLSLATFTPEAFLGVTDELFQGDEEWEKRFLADEDKQGACSTSVNDAEKEQFDRMASDVQPDDEDDPDFDGCGKVGGRSPGNSDSSSSTIVTGQAQKRVFHANASSKRTKKQRGGRKRKDEKSSVAAKKREFTKFKNGFDLWMTNEPTGFPEEWPKVNAEFLNYARHMVENSLSMDEHTEHTKKRLIYVLEEKNCSGKTLAEIWWMTVKSLGKVPRGIDYEKNECPVCKVAERKIVDQNGHNCLYCHDCFNESGWKKICVKLEDCKSNHNMET
mmetsp:Transcript_7291/g.18119  ORF Transcript_7291/g.18119 Transcript_7291/m.18119 type:complete len:335 (+) Transcript_7291:555-1559(+)